MDARAHELAAETGAGIWRDPSRSPGERVADLLGRMTIEEKLAQLASIWMGARTDGDGVAPMQDEFSEDLPGEDMLIRAGMGQLTRVFGTRPVPPAAAARALAQLQARIAAASRFGIPAIAHEECLTGFSAWTATAFPVPLAWGASFDPALVSEMAAAIGRSMRSVGVHQGLAPVLDVGRDPRWGRTEETIGEDPYLVGSVGAGYVRGLQSAGVHATLKHFAGYSASRAGRNMAPVSIGPREFGDVILPPFEMAIRAGARAVMPSYTDVDGVPVSGDARLLTRLLRDELGFDGVVVSDYNAVSFLETQHGVAAGRAEAAALALEAGVDVELPSVRCYGQPLADAVRDGRVPEDLVDRAAARVLRQKCELGLLDPGWSHRPPVAGADGRQVAGGACSADGAAEAGGPARPAVVPGELADQAQDARIDLDPPAHRVLARRLAEESVILLANGAAALPLGPGASVAVIGPLADDPLAFFGCYTMPRHLGPSYPEAATGLAVTPVLGALRAELPAARISYERGCDVRSADRSGIAAAVGAARAADVAVAVLGDESGLFGRGTSGEGCDVADLRLPGVQDELLRALAETGTPVVLVLITGRPYALSHVIGRLAAAMQSFFPGVEGGAAIAGVLSGRVVPGGRLPVEMPRSPGGQPSSYLRSRLAGPHSGSSVDPSPLFAFGHGLSYTTFAYTDLAIRAVPAPGHPPAEAAGAAGESHAGATRPTVPADGAVEIACTVRNTGARAGAEVVQLYLSSPVAQVVRPARWLAGFARVPLEAGEARRVAFRLHADRTAFHGRSGDRIVAPGEFRVGIGGSSDNLVLAGAFTLRGPERAAGPGRVLDTPVTVSGPPGQ
jgi:beta-xylosidase